MASSDLQVISTPVWVVAPVSIGLSDNVQLRNANRFNQSPQCSRGRIAQGKGHPNVRRHNRLDGSSWPDVLSDAGAI